MRVLSRQRVKKFFAISREMLMKLDQLRSPLLTPRDCEMEARVAASAGLRLFFIAVDDRYGTDMRLPDRSTRDQSARAWSSGTLIRWRRFKSPDLAHLIEKRKRPPRSSPLFFSTRSSAQR
jgi:hypothetical protein